LFNFCLGKASIIGSIKVQGGGGGSSDRLGGRVPFAPTRFLIFFPPSEERFLKRNQKQKKGRGVGSTTQHRLSTDRWMTFPVIDHEQTPYSDAHVCILCHLFIRCVSHAERSRCIDSFPSGLSPESALLTRNALSHVQSRDQA
jgi:hypothetical protein